MLGRPRFDPWVRKISWRREWLPTPGFLPGEFHRQRSLVGYSPWDCKESDMTEWLSLSLILYLPVDSFIVPMLHLGGTSVALLIAVCCCCCCCLVAKSYLTLCEPKDYSLQGSSVLGISQARILEWVVISFFMIAVYPVPKMLVAHGIEAAAPILWPPDAKNWLIGKDPDAGKDWRQEEKGRTEGEMVGWHHQLDEHEFEQAQGVGDEQGSLAWFSPWDHKKSDTTEWLN